MISYIKGLIAKKGTDSLIIENNGIGYLVNTSFNTLRALEEGKEGCVHTFMYIREDVLALYGFYDKDELDMFKKLISVNGVGPKAGIGILSAYDVNTLRVIILNEDAQKMSKAPGIGKKTASKIILELKDKVGSLDNIDTESVANAIDKGTGRLAGDESDIYKVLISLGFSQSEAVSALERIDISGKTENEIIKEALKIINS